ncbi:MAG TPA: MOSC N-terminal beta barrel domain-containing protein [Actinomycetales bacterium]|jgi:hypothetical protein
MSTPVGSVVSVRAFPVKSMDAAPLAGARVLRAGVQDDRGWAVVDGSGQVVTARTDDVLRTVVAAAGPDGPVLTVPGAPAPVHGAAADDALSTLLGRAVRVQAGEAFTEVAPVHLVSRQAIARGHEQHAEDDGGECPCSVEEPRANLVLELDGSELETSWVGVDLVVGGATLRVSKAPRHCLGVYADVLVEGDVAEGDEAVLLR